MSYWWSCSGGWIVLDVSALEENLPRQHRAVGCATTFRSRRDSSRQRARPRPPTLPCRADTQPPAQGAPNNNRNGHDFTQLRSTDKSDSGSTMRRLEETTLCAIKRRNGERQGCFPGPQTNQEHGRQAPCREGFGQQTKSRPTAQGPSQKARGCRGVTSRPIGALDDRHHYLGGDGHDSVHGHR